MKLLIGSEKIFEAFHDTIISTNIIYVGLQNKYNDVSFTCENEKETRERKIEKNGTNKHIYRTGRENALYNIKLAEKTKN